VSAKAEKVLVEPYQEGFIPTWGLKKFNLDDLWIPFLGLAARPDHRGNQDAEAFGWRARRDLNPRHMDS
jgi:hypothetical protein